MTGVHDIDGTRPAADAVRGNVLYGPRSLSGFPARHLNGMAIASMIVGIVSFVLPVFGLTSATAVLLGWAAKSQIRRFSSEMGRGLAVAGTTLAVVSFLVHLLLFGLYAAALSEL
jgi:hypothetical protein